MAGVRERAQILDRSVQKNALRDASVKRNAPTSIMENASNGRNAGNVGTECSSTNSLASRCIVYTFLRKVSKKVTARTNTNNQASYYSKIKTIINNEQRNRTPTAITLTQATTKLLHITR